jgi:hypothetical protein
MNEIPEDDLIERLSAHSGNSILEQFDENDEIPIEKNMDLHLQ